MHEWVGLAAWEERRAELVREAERGRLVRRLREARKERRRAEALDESRDVSVEVRWGLPEDEPKVADLLELNGLPRWVAFEERFIVAEKSGEVVAAVRYRTEPKRLLLGLLVADPWAEERSLAVALYAGARELARETGTREVWAGIHPRVSYPGAGELAREMGIEEDWAETDRRVEYLRGAGYRRRVGGWCSDAPWSPGGREELPARGWRRTFALLGTLAVPFFRASL